MLILGILLYLCVDFLRNDVQKLNKTLFIRSVCALVGVLFIIRLCFPSVARTSADAAGVDSAGVAVGGDSTAVVESAETAAVAAAEAPAGSPASADSLASTSTAEPTETAAAAESSDGPAAASGAASTASASTTFQPFAVPRLDFSSKHPIRGVYSYRECFPDIQDVQIVAARAHGVTPVASRADAEKRKSELLYIGANPYYEIDPRMNRSIPYLVPRASHLLEHISRRFLDSLAVKQIPLHKLIVTSVLRTEEDVARLQRYNHNATEQSCHRFGTTFDISYNRFHTVSPPGGPERRAVRNDSLKFVLSEVLRDAREEGRCYVKYEVKQGCFHITVR